MKRLLFLLVLAACRQPDPRLLTDLPDLDTPAADLAQAMPDGAQPLPDLAGAPDHCNATDPRLIAPVVYATPETGEQPYLDLLASAQSSIRVAIYLMGYGGILDTLVAKAQAGISVRVILDQGARDTNQKYADQLSAAGVEVLWSDPQFPYMHAKLIVVDGREALISTGNFSRQYSILKERNFVARLADPADVADLAALFDADWVGAPPDVSCTRLLIAPLNARARILSLIDSAQGSLQIESMQLADSEVRAAIAARAQAGVALRVLLAEPSWISANASAAQFVAGLGGEARSLPHLHTKVIVVDGAAAYLGSENLSYTSLSRNREVGLITLEASAVQPLVETFAKDWAVAQPL